jgi:hypothetical protein
MESRNSNGNSAIVKFEVVQAEVSQPMLQPMKIGESEKPYLYFFPRNRD